MNATSAAAIAGWIIGGVTAMATPGPIRVLDSIQGTSFLATEAAVRVIEKQKPAPDLVMGSFELLRDDHSEVVLFTDRHQRRGVRVGSAEELTSQDLQAILLTRPTLILVDRFQGTSFLAMRTAADAFRHYQPDLNQYRIETMAEGQTLVVTFTDKSSPPNVRGTVGLPGFEVAIDPNGWKVLRSNFVR